MKSPIYRFKTVLSNQTWFVIIQSELNFGFKSSVVQRSRLLQTDLSNGNRFIGFKRRVYCRIIKLLNKFHAIHAHSHQFCFQQTYRRHYSVYHNIQFFWVYCCRVATLPFCQVRRNKRWIYMNQITVPERKFVTKIRVRYHDPRWRRQQPVRMFTPRLYPGSDG